MIVVQITTDGRRRRRKTGTPLRETGRFRERNWVASNSCPFAQFVSVSGLQSVSIDVYPWLKSLLRRRQNFHNFRQRPFLGIKKRVAPAIQHVRAAQPKRLINEFIRGQPQKCLRTTAV